jgi:hypothetical protein
MSTPRLDEVTQLLKAWAGGDERALDRLTPFAILTGPSQVLVQQRENGNANHRHRAGGLQGLERDSEQQQCDQSRTDDREDDRGQQSAAAENVPTDERQRATHAHKGQCQHVRRTEGSRRKTNVVCGDITTDRRLL